MSYTICKNIPISYEQSIIRVTKALELEGFNIVTEIDIYNEFVEVLNIETDRFIILGAYSPSYAYKLFLETNKLGLLIPCNFVIKEISRNITMICVANPVNSFKMFEEPLINSVALQLKRRFTRMIETL